MTTEEPGAHSSERSSEERGLVIDLRSTARAPVAARHAVEGLIEGDVLAGSQLDTLKLLVSEIVTNAVMHAEATPDADLQVSVTVTDESTRIVVSDCGQGFVPSEGSLPRGRVGGGYGLMLLDALASRWGTRRGDDLFSVWFEVDHVTPRSAARSHVTPTTK